MKSMIGFVLALAIVVSGLSIYLSPNGLDDCDVAPSSKAECQKVDAIVAISGGDTAARTAQAIQLFKNGWAEKLVFSGAALDKSGPSNALAMKRQAMNESVPESAILIEESSMNTKQNAELSRQLFEDNDIRSVILVTSAYHQRRAGLEFGKMADNTIRIVNHPVESDNQWSPWWWTTPRGWWLATSEFFKILVFYAGGYVR